MIRSKTWRWTAMAAMVAASGCGVGDEDGQTPGTDTEIKTETDALLTNAVHGVDCGMSYSGGTSIFGFCNNYGTLTSPFSPPPGWAYGLQVDGDRGMPSGQGFKHQSWLVNNQLTALDSLPLPKGTACGFKEACNNSGETCFNNDPNSAINPCPSGWIKRSAPDRNAPSGCNFVWCEYLDWHSQCVNSTCINNMPSGLTCGITDSDNPVGLCNGINTATVGCPTINGRPSIFRGYRDAGRPAGHGIGWCELQ